jgi:hypothetical protein
MKGVVAAAIGLFALAFFVPLNASAHEPDTFTVIVRNDSHSPSTVVVYVNDTVQYKNEDHRENVTHYVGFDSNGDGDFDDIGEFGSGPLNATCDWDNDSNCRTAWIFKINNSDYAGDYELIDYTNTNETHNVSLVILTDTHTEAPSPNIGDCFGDCEEEISEESEVDEEISSTDLLQRGGAFFLLLAAILAISIHANRKN